MSGERVKQVSENRNDEKPVANIRTITVGAALSLVISFSCLLLVLRFTRSENVWRDLLQVGFKTLSLSLGLVVMSWLVDALRLQILASALTKSVSLWDAFKISVMGSFMAGVTPFDTGGEPLKVYFLHRQGLSIGESTAVVTLSAFLHATFRLVLWLLVPVVMLVSGISWKLTAAVKVTLSFGLGVYLAFLGLIAVVTLWPQSVETLASRLCGSKALRRFLKPSSAEAIIRKVSVIAGDFREGLRRVKQRGGHAAVASFLSLAYWLLIMSVPVFLLRGMGTKYSAIEVFSVSMTVYLVMAYMPTPGASGGAEVGSALFFAPLIPAKVLGIFVVAWRFVTYYGSMVAVEALLGTLRKSNLPNLH